MKNNPAQSLIAAAFFQALTLIAAPPAVVAQAGTPAESAQDIIAGLKSGGGFGAIVGNVDWDFLFSQMPASARESLGVNSPADLRAYNERFYRNPGQSVMYLAITGDSKLSPEKAASIANKTEEQIARNNHKLAAADYSVGNATANGDTAVVAVTVLIDQNSTQTEFRLRQSSGRWLLAEYPPSIEIETAPPDASGTDGPKAAPQP